MSFMDRIMKLVGKDGFHIDSTIGKRYVFHLCCKYGIMLIRGKLFAFGNKKINGDVFIGKHVCVIPKNKIVVGCKVKLHNYVYIDALSLCGVQLNDYVVIGRNCRIECTGGLQNIGKGIVIGARTTFGNDCYFGAAGGIEIGSDVIAGQYVRFHSENHNFDSLNMLIREQGIRRQGIKVGNNCWIGAGAVFLDGAELGNGCVVAANAVVTEVFPPNSVIAGVPARFIRKRGNQDGR